MKLQHIVVTMFNIKVWTKDKNNQDTLNDEWLDNRFGLFEKYCLPSMVQQTEKDFLWLCLFDTYTAEKYKHKIEGYKLRCEQMQPVFMSVSEGEDFKISISNVIKKYVNSSASHILTTNLDNDDALNKDMIKELQLRAYKQKKDCLLNCFYGYQLFEGKKLVIKMRYPHNHFQSLLVENKLDFKTVEDFKHAKLNKIYNTVEIYLKKPMWLELVHSGNVNNDLRITSRINNKCPKGPLSLSDFGIDFNLSESQCRYNKYIIFPKIFSKIGIMRLKRKFLKMF